MASTSALGYSRSKSKEEGYLSLFALTYNDSELILVAPRMRGYSYTRLPLPAGLVKSGRISNPSSFSPLVTQAMKAARPSAINADEVVIGLPEEQVFIKVIELPSKLKPKEIQTVLEYQWQNLIPIARDQVYFDSLVLPPRDKKKHDTQRLLIAAYPQDIIDSLVTSLNQIGIRPKKIMPISFGSAALYGTKTHETVLVAMSTFGQDITISLVRDKTARFSTTIHAAVTSAAALKQLGNIRSFYEKSVAEEGESVASVVILPSPYATTLVQQAGALALPITLAQAEPLVQNKEDDTALGPLLPLIGLLKTRIALSILPKEMVNDRELTFQKSALRTIIAYTSLVFVFLLYFSLIFYGSLYVNNKTKIHYAAGVVTRANDETTKVNQSVATVNQEISHLLSLQTKRSHTAPLIQIVEKTSRTVPQLTITTLTVEAQTTATVLRLEGTQTSPTAATQFATILKQDPLFAQAKVDIPPASAATPTYSMTITLGTTP